MAKITKKLLKERLKKARRKAGIKPTDICYYALIPSNRKKYIKKRLEKVVELSYSILNKEPDTNILVVVFDETGKKEITHLTLWDPRTDHGDEKDAERRVIANIKSRLKTKLSEDIEIEDYLKED